MLHFKVAIGLFIEFIVWKPLIPLIPDWSGKSSWKVQSNHLRKLWHFWQLRTATPLSYSYFFWRPFQLIVDSFTLSDDHDGDIKNKCESKLCLLWFVCSVLSEAKHLKTICSSTEIDLLTFDWDKNSLGSPDGKSNLDHKLSILRKII